MGHLLHQWPAFLSYFESKSENQKSSHIQKRLKDPQMKLYASFLHNVTQCFDKFNLIFQNKAPVLFKLDQSIQELLHDMPSRFSKPKVLREHTIKDIDVSNTEIHLPDEELFIGYLARRQLLSEEGKEMPPYKTKQFF